MLFGLVMGSLAFLSPDIIGGILGVSADNAAGRGARHPHLWQQSQYSDHISQM